MNRYLILSSFLAFAVSLEAEAGGGCYAACRSEGGQCKVTTTKGIPEDFPRTESPRLLKNCLDLTAAVGPILIQFSSANKWKEALIPSGQAFSDRLASHRRLDCVVGDGSKCESGGVNPVFPVKNFGPSAPKEQIGEPCRLGFPCGKVGLSADGSLPIRLIDPAMTGSLNFYSSAAKADKTVQVSAGSALVPANALEPGQAYRYRFILSDGKEPAAGEFFVMARMAQQESDALLEEALKRPVDARRQAVESLLLDGRQWEAFQRTLKSDK